MINEIIIVEIFDKIKPESNLPGETFNTPAQRIKQIVRQWINKFLIPRKDHSRLTEIDKRH